MVTWARAAISARDAPGAYSTMISMNSKLEFAESAISETQIRLWPVFSGPLPGVATAFEVANWVQLAAADATTPQLTRENVLRPPVGCGIDRPSMNTPCESNSAKVSPPSICGNALAPFKKTTFESNVM